MRNRFLTSTKLFRVAMGLGNNTASLERASSAYKLSLGRNLHSSEEKAVRLYGDGDRMMKFIEMDSGIYEKMSSITLASLMIRNNPPEAFAYFEKSCFLHNEEEISKRDILCGKFKVEISTPTFIWGFKRGFNSEYFLLSCKRDFELTFPVKRISINNEDISVYELNNTIDFLNHLDELFIKV